MQTFNTPLDRPPGFQAARIKVAKFWEHHLRASRNHPDPETGKNIRIIGTRAITALSGCKTHADLANVQETAENELKALETPHAKAA